MGALSRTTALMLATIGASDPTRAAADTVSDWRPFVIEASARFHVPVRWIEQVMRAESGGRRTLQGRPIVSRAGAMGLMQLMPRTWSAIRTILHLGADPHDPHDNILAGSYYLAKMYQRFGYPGLFGAYNAGPARYAAHLKGAALPAETIHYLAQLTGSEEAGRVAPAPIGALRPPALFVVIHRAAAGPAGQTGSAHPLFAIP